ncbi:MAG: response regulator [Candidatus Protochlamydia sp.]|nr:response regulator [Candidatus Protochlamydia sp.]
MLSFFDKNWKKIQSWPWVLLRKNSFTNLLLCIDDDKDFCLYLQGIAKKLKIKLEMAYSLSEGRQKMEENEKYQGFIIDGHLPDGSGFELVEWIREERGLKQPIIFLSRIYQDAGSFRTLKEKLNVEFVVDKPIDPLEVAILLKQVCQLRIETDEIQEKTEEEFDEILIRYEKSIPEKIERLEEEILNLQRNPTLENLKIFKTEIHKIAGSAGSYGHMKVSELCKKMEKKIEDQSEASNDGIGKEWLESLDEFFTQIKLNFQIKN